MQIRPETAADAAAIAALTTAAFAGAPHASGTEAAIIAALRKAGALHLSLVATEAGRVIGHVAFSPVRIDGRACGWFGLGPIAVAPDRQGQGLGGALIREGLARLHAEGAKGCVLLGDPGYYTRFGFVADPGLTLPGVPAPYFLRLVLAGPAPVGRVAYHPGFSP